MILKTEDWIFFIFVFILLSGVFYFSIKGKLRFQYTFSLSTMLIGAIMLWGVINSDASTFPVWIQAGATLMLLVVTGLSTYAALEMARATQNQALMQVKELKRELVIEFSNKIIQTIRSILKWESDFLDSGFFIVHYKDCQKDGKLDYIHYRTPRGILKDYILIQGLILQKNLRKISESNIKFDDYTKNLDSLLKRIVEKEDNFIEDFNTYCLYLRNQDDLEDLTKLSGDALLEAASHPNVNVTQDEEEVFMLALSDSKCEKYVKYDFFNRHRQELTSKLVSAGFKLEIDEYKQIKESFSEIKNEYDSIFNKLIREWKEEYFVTDSDLESVAYP